MSPSTTAARSFPIPSFSISSAGAPSASSLSNSAVSLLRRQRTGCQALPAEAIARADALIVPALAVDRGGRRLGQGGGWYDRMLPLRRDGVGVFAMVYDDELVPGPLPTEEHDEVVDAVITPSAWFLLEGSAFAAGS